MPVTTMQPMSGSRPQRSNVSIDLEMSSKLSALSLSGLLNTSVPTLSETLVMITVSVILSFPALDNWGWDYNRRGCGLGVGDWEGSAIGLGFSDQGSGFSVEGSELN